MVLMQFPQGWLAINDHEGQGAPRGHTTTGYGQGSETRLRGQCLYAHLPLGIFGFGPFRQY